MIAYQWLWIHKLKDKNEKVWDWNDDISPENTLKKLTLLLLITF